MPHEQQVQVVVKEKRSGSNFLINLIVGVCAIAGFLFLGWVLMGQQKTVVGKVQGTSRTDKATEERKIGFSGFSIFKREEKKAPEAPADHDVSFEESPGN